jgi:hypothetical protein
MREEALIFRDLSLCTSRGYVHSLAYSTRTRQPLKMLAWRASNSTAGGTISEPAPHSPAWTVSRWPV